MQGFPVDMLWRRKLQFPSTSDTENLHEFSQPFLSGSFSVLVLTKD